MTHYKYDKNITLYAVINVWSTEPNRRARHNNQQTLSTSMVSKESFYTERNLLKKSKNIEGNFYHFYLER